MSIHSRSSAVVTLALCCTGSATFTPARGVLVPSTCDALRTLTLPNVRITRAEVVAAGTFAPEAREGPTDAFRTLPAFCRIAATLTPTSDSDIQIEVWMPASGWNRKFQAVGNGGFSGAIAYRPMAAALAGRYATASTDTGHAGGSARFALGHPEKVIDFGWRAVHEMTVASKAIVAAYYDAGPAFSYWNGCSAGGRQALKEAQRFPSDFDGIIAGAPGLDWTGRAAQAVRVAKVLEANEPARLSPSQIQLVHRSAIQACDAADAVKDGVIDDPARCTFDPGVLQCRGSEPCLAPAQVETVRLMYSAPLNPRTRRAITGLAPGSEAGWTSLGWTASARATGLDQFRFIVFKDPAWDIQRFDFAQDVVRAEEVDAATINALDPNLKPFLDRGGKLIQYHGWSDPQISPGNSTQYYSRVAEALGGASRIDTGYRLFMAPGMAHCGGGDGPNAFDMLRALEAWVERGTPPDRILASHSTGGVVDRTRPLCPYPQVAIYRGSGSTDDAANFVCGTR